MKKIVLFSVSVFLTFLLNAQITEEKTYYNAGIGGNTLTLMYFENSGPKYVYSNLDSLIIKFYNLDHSVYTTINIDTTNFHHAQNDGFDDLYYSENLFDLDDNIEFILICWYYDVDYYIYVIDDDGSIMFEANADLIYYASEEPNSIFNTPNGTKMILQYNWDSTKVFSMPGTLPCFNCDGTLSGTKGAPSTKSTMNLSNSYPNPSRDYTRIDYQLPKGINKGTIVIYDINGKETKRYEVDRTFNHLRISTTDMPSGTYFYNLQTEQGVSQGKKMIKIK